MQKNEIRSNYDIQADDARRLFLGYDQQQIIKRYRLSADEQWLYLEYLHIPCRISRSSGIVEMRERQDVWKECRDFNTVMTIYDLLCYAKGDTAPVLSGEWCTVGHFAAVTSPSASGFTKKYEAVFLNRVKEVETACKSLGGILQKRIAGADITCLIPVTPYFPVLLQFWDGDEEFPPKLSLLWDRNAMEFLHFETTFYLQGDILERLGREMQAKQERKSLEEGTR